MVNNKNIIEAYSSHLTDKDLIRKTSLYDEYETTLENKVLRIKYLTSDLFKEKIRKNYSKIERTQELLKNISQQYPIKKILEKNAIGFLFSEIYFSDPNSKKNEIISIIPWIKNLEELVGEKGALKKEKAYRIYEQIKLIKDIAASQNIEIQNLDPRDIYIFENKVLVSNVESRGYEIEVFEKIEDIWESSKWPTSDLILEMMLGRYKDGIAISGAKQEELKIKISNEGKKEEKLIEKKIPDKNGKKEKEKYLRGITVDGTDDIQIGGTSAEHSKQDYQTIPNTLKKDEKLIEELFDPPKDKNKGYPISIRQPVQDKIKTGKEAIKIKKEVIKKKYEKKPEVKIDEVDEKSEKDKFRGWHELWGEDGDDEEDYDKEDSNKYDNDSTNNIKTSAKKEGDLEKEVKEEKIKSTRKEENKNLVYEEELIIPGKASFRKVSKDKALKRALLYLNGPTDKFGESKKDGAIDKAIKIFRKNNEELFKRGEGKGTILEIDSRKEVKEHIKFPNEGNGDYRKYVYVGKIKVIKIKK